MKTTLIFTAAALACGVALAQAPAGVNPSPSNQQNPTMSGGKAQANAEMNKRAPSGAMAPSTTTMGNAAMDLNGDGMISRKEWNAHHGRMWGGMKANKQGMVPWAEVEARMKGGPN